MKSQQEMRRGVFQGQTSTWRIKHFHFIAVSKLNKTARLERANAL